MANLLSEQDLKKLGVNIVPNSETFTNMISNGQVQQDEFYFVEGDTVADEAIKLKQGHSLQVDLNSHSSSTPFDGTADVHDIGVSGILEVDYGGTGANNALGARRNLMGSSAVGSQLRSIYWNGSDFTENTTSLTNGTYTAAVTTSPYKPVLWKFDAGITPQDGDMILIKAPGAGHDYGVFLSLDNGTTYYPIGLQGNDTGRLTTHFSSGQQIMLVFEASQSIASIFPVAGSASRVTSTGGAWIVINYDSGNAGDWNLRQYSIKAAAAITAYHIIGGTSSGYKNIDSGNAFDISYAVMYAGTAISNGSTGSNNYIHHYSVNLKNSSNSNITLTAYKNVYIKGTLDGTTFTPYSSSNPYTQTLPTTDDGYYYYYIGRAYSTSAMTFDTTSRDIFVYKDNAIRKYADYAPVRDYYDKQDVTFSPSDTALTSSSTIAAWDGHALKTISNENLLKSTLNSSAIPIALTGDVTGTANSTSSGWSIATTIGAGKVTNNMLAGSITNSKLMNAEIGIAGNQVALGSGIAASTLLSSLGLSSAMHFIGVSTTAISDGATTSPITVGGSNHTPAAGDVVIYGNNEYVWTSGGAWELLGQDGSFKVVQTAYNSNTITSASANTSLVVSDVSQNAQGVITVTKKNVNTPQSFIIKANGSSAENAGYWSFDGSTVRTINFVPGAGISVIGSNGQITIAATGIGTDDKVKQTNTTSNTNYRVLLSHGANDNEETDQSYKSAQLLFNPYTKTVTAENFAGTATTALSAGAFTSNATVTLTGDTTGTSAGSTKSWSVPTVTKYISGLGRRTSAAAIALNPSVDTGFKMTWHISDSTSRTNDATNSPSFDAAIINLPWDWGGYNGQIAISNTAASNTRMQIRSATHIDNGSSANPRYTPSYGAWREVVTATKATQIGSSTTPIYISNTGQAIACGDSLDVSITGNAATATTVLWNGINNKPETATRWPKWNEITQQGANSIEEGTSDFTDNTEIFSSYASNNGFADTNATGKVYRRDAIKMYNYIKTKAGTSGSGFNIAGSSASCTGNAASASKVNSSLVIKVSDGGTETEGTNKWTFDGSTTKSITIAAGTGISLTGNANTGFTITSTAIGTDDKVKQTNTTTNANYRVLLSHSANDTEETSQSYKSSGLLFNPSTNTLTATNFAGTATKVGNSLAIRIPKASGASDWTEDSTKWTFDGSGPKVIDIAAGSGISITSSTNGFTITNTARDSHYTTAMYLGASNSATTNNASNTTSPYLMILDNSTVRNRIQFTGSGATTVIGTTSSSNPTGTVTISSTDENVQQLIDNSGNVNYRLLLTKEANTQNTVGTTHFSTNLIFNPSTGLLSGPNLTLTGTLSVGGTTTLTGALSANGGISTTTLSVSSTATFTVTPTAPTAAAGTNDTTLATTAFVNQALQSGAMGNGSPLKVARYDGTGGVIEAAPQHTVNNYQYVINDATDGGQSPAFKLVGKNQQISLLIGSGNDNRGLYNDKTSAWMLYWDSNNYAILNSGKFGVNGSNTSYNFYVNGTSYLNGNTLIKGNTTHNGIVYFANGTTYYVNNSAQGYLANLSVGTGSNTSYKLYVAGESYFNGNANTKNIYHWNGNAVQDGSWVTGTTGTASATGTNILTLGNATATGTANNSKGYLRIYGGSTGYAEVTYNDTRLQSDKSLYFSTSTTSGISNEVRGIMATNDYWRIAGGATAENSGYLEIATANEGTEPIYVRQYANDFSSATRTLTLLDASGNSEFPGYIKRVFTASNQEPMLWMNGMDYDNYLFQISSGSGNGKQYYGYAMKYIGTGSGAANYLQLLADNQNGTDVIAIGIDQAGRIGIGDNASTDYRLYVNGDSQFKGSLLPYVTDTYDLGSATLRWKTMYVSQFNPDYTYKNSATVTVKASEWTNIIAGNTTGLDDGTYIIQLKITSTSNTAYYSGICSWIKASSSAVDTYSEIPLHAVQKGLANQFYLRTAIDGSGIYLQISQSASTNTSLAANAMTILFKKIM